MTSIGSIRYSLREPFERAVESVCKSLAARGLRITGQLDVSTGVQRTLGIGLPPCRIVFVLPDPDSLPDAGIHPWAGVFLPLHVVLSANGAHTEILVQNKVQTAPDASAFPVMRPVAETQVRIAEAMEAIAVRASLVV
jgi:uncharacterized protein (DUF302 family)